MASKLIKYTLLFVMSGYIASCQNVITETAKAVALDNQPYISVLGIAQDAGYPQINCKKSCCTTVWVDPTQREKVSCIGICDPRTQKVWLIDATPDIRDQLYQLQNGKHNLEGIFLTHAHIGHYTGLMHLGREALGSDHIPVYAMPKMKEFLKNNGPWSQLVTLNNIRIHNMNDLDTINLASDIQITPFIVPHRDEFSETVGYVVTINTTRVLFIPDIDKWEKWDTDILQFIHEVDYALLDGSFYRNGEIWGRDMSQIPHPFIEESMALFQELDDTDKNKIYFIHLNHTNPLLDHKSDEFREFSKSGFRLASEGQIIK